jgi:serine/threonine protein kinase
MGLIHRDIKPANVIVCEQGGVPDVVKVLDFGLVKDTHNPHEAEQTANKTFLGTPLYASPEAVKGGEITAASDMYAVAAVGYYLLTGTDVFGGSTIMEVGAGHLYKDVEAPSLRVGKPLPPALERLILQGLAKDPAARPSDARSFRQALARCGVSPWPEDDAVAWWQSHGRELVRLRVSKAIAPAAAPAALAVTLAGRQDLA